MIEVAEENCEVKRRRPPAKSVEARENQLIALAVDLAEAQLAKGTASSQVITHYLKLGSTKEKLEKELLEGKKVLMQAKTEALTSTKNIEELYKKALASMSTYRGSSDDEDL